MAGARQRHVRSRRVTIEHLTAGQGERLCAIRIRSLRDAPDAFAITLEQAAAWSLEEWNRQLDQAATFVATDGISDVGLVRGATLDERPDAAYLLSMWVAPDARRQGVASALVDAVVGWARARGFSRVVLHVTETNGAAFALYTRKGFVPTGEVMTLPPPREHIREVQMGIEL
jgi:ribosomal protein S18 acetylase RimI-like enzyme